MMESLLTKQIGVLLTASAYAKVYLKHPGTRLSNDLGYVAIMANQYLSAIFQSLSTFKVIEWCLLGLFLALNLVRWSLFGKLSDNELKHLKDKVSYTIWEFWFGFFIFLREIKQNQNLDQVNTIVRHEFIKYSGLFFCVLLLKSFHFIFAERAYSLSSNFNSSQSTVLEHNQYRRLGYGVLVINILDILLMGSFFTQMYSVSYGNSPLKFEDNILVTIFGFEILHSYPLVFFTGVRYLLNYYEKIHFIDNATSPQQQLTWQARKNQIINLTELSVNLVRFGMTCVFGIIFLYFYTFPLHVLPSSYLSLRLLIVKSRCLISLERRNLKLRRLNLPTVIQPHSRCVICFDDLKDSSVDGVRCLNACEHNFHYSCLKSWLEYSNDCPICRATI